ncbi:MAG: peptidylprolyl isomerase [Bacteroidia bacterium]|nr:peptidylprolyl isomerase [Bacteroidia bacterium]
MKRILLIFCAIAFALSSYAQQDSNDNLLTIAGQEISKSEFLRVYQKNNTKELSFDDKSVREYLDLYINYKLKVKQAEDEKMDTIPAFQKELAGYRKQLARPYMNDQDVTDALIKEAYERLKTDIRASHVLIRVAENAPPKDSLTAYNRALDARNRILKGDEFSSVAQQLSDDKSAANNGGDLGYFTALMMVYPFESAVYNTNAGDVTMPVRTRFGYHVIKVFDKRAAMGELKVAHIMVKTQGSTSDDDEIAVNAKKKIGEIYGLLKNGQPFSEVAKTHSEDQGTSKSGGVIPPFGTGKMVADFERAAYNLKNAGDFSEPVKTSFGWHIISLIERKSLVPFEEKERELKNLVSRDSRADASKKAKIKQIKKEYSYNLNRKALEQIFSKLDSSLTTGQWDTKKAEGLNKPLFNIGTDKFSQTDFVEYLGTNQSRKLKTGYMELAANYFQFFVDEKCLAYEEKQLETKYPEFRTLMQEYRDGILLFDLTDKKVWSKAVNDSAGLATFYDENKDQYMWNNRVEAEIYTCKDADMAQKVRKLIKKGMKPNEITKEVNEDSQLNCSVMKGKYSKGDNELIDSKPWTVGVSEDIKKESAIVIINYKELIPSQRKTLKEAKGIVTSDYQNYLEEKWIGDLRGKYDVKVNEDVLSSIIQ